MPLIPNIALFQRKLGGFPIATYQAGETVIAAASTTGRLLILRTGAVAVLREGVEIATVREPGAVFGELSVLLDQPHSADVRALEVSQFYVADAATLLRVDPVALLYVATVLARRLDDANQALIELRRQLEAGRPRSVIETTAEEIEGLLGASANNMAYARYPYLRPVRPRRAEQVSPARRALRSELNGQRNSRAIVRSQSREHLRYLDPSGGTFRPAIAQLGWPSLVPEKPCADNLMPDRRRHAPPACLEGVKNSTPSCLYRVSFLLRCSIAPTLGARLSCRLDIAKITNTSSSRTVSEPLA